MVHHGVNAGVAIGFNCLIVVLTNKKISKKHHYQAQAAFKQVPRSGLKKTSVQL
jgi:hypothetical protein